MIQQQSNASPFHLVLFGSTGDLVTRKIIPALYSAFTHDSFSTEANIFALGRKDLTTDEYCSFALEKAKSLHVTIDLNKWQEFIKLIKYVKLDATTQTDYANLAKTIGTQDETIYYLSTDPGLFSPICANLAAAKLNHKNSRIVLEKPLGNNLESNREINDFVAKFFSEQQIYRIDHYLGKESVQNLMAIRFGNTLFEALWRRQWISSIQISIAEDIGVESRGEFYNKNGALRDMLQNHLLQLLCITAMEPPFSLDADVVRNEKLKVLQSLKPLKQEDVVAKVVSGQYTSGTIDGENVCGYLEEEHVPNDSNTETFVALKAEIQNWRWAGVPFYLRTGKRMKDKIAEIVVQFKELPCTIFPISHSTQANRLIIKLQPDETIKLYFMAKRPGEANELSPVYLDLDFNKMFTTRRIEGYERLLLDVIHGNLTLFVRRDEQAAAWKWVEPIINTWKSLNIKPKPYKAGSWGPAAAAALLAMEGASWHEELM